MRGRWRSFDLLGRLKAHVCERTFVRHRSAIRHQRVPETSGTRSVIDADIPGDVPQVTKGSIVRCIDLDTVSSNTCILIGRQLTPRLDGRVPAVALWRKPATLQVRERRFIRRDQSGFCTGLDAHVADGHPAFHRHILDRRAGIFDHVAGSAVGADPVYDRRGSRPLPYAEGNFAFDADAKIL